MVRAVLIFSKMFSHLETYDTIGCTTYCGFIKLTWKQFSFILLKTFTAFWLLVTYLMQFAEGHFESQNNTRYLHKQKK